MNKRAKILIIIVAAVIAAYLAYRWYSARKAASNQAAGLGANLNSVAPQMTGGATSTGPNVGPAVSAPINITLNDAGATPPEQPDTDQVSGQRPANPLARPPMGGPVIGPPVMHPMSGTAGSAESDDTDVL